MPKILVVIDAAAPAADADAVVEGARSVRFAEVDVRRARQSADELAAYDAVIVGGAGAMPLLAEGSLGDRVAAAVGGDAWDVLHALGARGAIIVPPDGDPRTLGARVAKVAEWVRHAKSHEAKPGHAHHH